VIVSIHQPNYIPWLGFWDKFLKSDTMILLDVVQFEKNEFQNRQKIKLSNGQSSWLSVPVHHKHPQAISTIQIDSSSNGSWVKKHLHALRFNYERAGWWKEYGEEISGIYHTYGKGLMTKLNRELIVWVALHINDGRKVLMASDLLGKEEDLDSDPTQRIIDLCDRVGANTYLTGRGALDYLCKEDFANAGIGLRIQKFTHPIYPQLYGEFVPNLSVMDLILNVGAEEAKQMLNNPTVLLDPAGVIT